MASKRVTQLREMSHRFGALEFIINFSSVTVTFPPTGNGPDLYMAAVHKAFGKSVRTDFTRYEERQVVSLSLG